MVTSLKKITNPEFAPAIDEISAGECSDGQRTDDSAEGGCHIDDHNSIVYVGVGRVPQIRQLPARGLWWGGAPKGRIEAESRTALFFP